VAAFDGKLRAIGTGRGGKAKDETLTANAVSAYRGPRARKGKASELGFKPTLLLRV
jgi:topoisomerase-4 subunit A